jgi:hypothetical protein
MVKMFGVLLVQVARRAEIAHPQVLNRDIAKDRSKELVHRAALHERDERQGEYLEGVLNLEELLDRAEDAGVVPAQGVEACDDRPHAGPADHVYRDARSLQGPQNADVSDCFRTASPEDHAH